MIGQLEGCSNFRRITSVEWGRDRIEAIFSVGSGARKESLEHICSRRNSWVRRAKTHVQKERDG